MSYTFTNYAGIPAQEYKPVLSDIIGNILGGYQEGTKAGYLQPTLEEQLKKSKLYNQYYGPNMESQMGLRGAQAQQAQAHTGLLGEQTKAAHLTNEYLPTRLKAQAETQQLAAAQASMFNNMLKQRLASAQINGLTNQDPSPQYNPGQGQAPFTGNQSSPFLEANNGQPAPQDINQTRQMPYNYENSPEFNNDLINGALNKKLFNLDTFTPKFKAYIDSITKNMNQKQSEQIKLEAKKALANFKTMDAAQKDLPKINDALKAAYRMKDIINNRPAFFGHWLAPNLFAKRANDELAGEFQSALVPQIAGIEKQLSETGNQLALRISENKVPQFGDSQAVAKGKINSIIDELIKSQQRTQDLAGGNIVRKGNKRYKFIDGHWYEVDRNGKK